MNTISNNITFGEKIPTEYFLKTALKLQNFDEAKFLIQYTQGVKTSGKYGFHQRAMKYAEQILEKNKLLKDIVDDLKSKNLSQEEQIIKIGKITSELGQYVDITV